MSTQLMNEAEIYLLEHWAEAALLEDAMMTIRTKYTEMFGRVAEAITAVHPELDVNRIAVTQFWGEGYFGMGRGTWPTKNAKWPAGFWLTNLRLELLAGEDTDPPYANIQIAVAKGKLKSDIDVIRTELYCKAKELLNPDEFNEVTKGDSGDVLLWLPGPSKQSVLSALAGDGQDFIKLFVAQYDMMARFIPAIDDIAHTYREEA